MECELYARVVNVLKAQAAAFYDEGLGKLKARYEKGLFRSGDYVQK